MMKKTLLSVLFLSAVVMQTSSARTIDIDIQGMSCAFCAESLNRNFKAMKSVSKVEVDLKLKTVHLETAADSPKIETIKKTIVDSGFTPVNVVVKP